MARPVVHFEVIGRTPDQLRRYYGDLFGWTFDTPSPVAPEVSEADSYGFIELIASDDGTGIRGGIGGGKGYDSHCLLRRGSGCRSRASAR
jgi:predicted enzyme related to lactoylglutathione lyase